MFCVIQCTLSCRTNMIGILAPSGCSVFQIDEIHTNHCHSLSLSSDHGLFHSSNNWVSVFIMRRSCASYTRVLLRVVTFGPLARCACTHVLGWNMTCEASIMALFVQLSARYPAVLHPAHIFEHCSCEDPNRKPSTSFCIPLLL